MGRGRNETVVGLSKIQPTFLGNFGASAAWQSNPHGAAMLRLYTPTLLSLQLQVNCGRMQLQGKGLSAADQTPALGCLLMSFPTAGQWILSSKRISAPHLCMLVLSLCILKILKLIFYIYILQYFSFHSFDSAICFPL